MTTNQTISPEEKKLDQKSKRRIKKINPRMKVSGKSVQQVQRLIKDKHKKVRK